MKNVHILGASGFIGKCIFKELSDDKNLLVRGYSSTECNLLSKESITNSLLDVTREDVIIMASSITRLKENSFESSIKNMQMAENMINFMENNPPGQFFFLSTIDVYGLLKEGVKINERNIPNPCDYYAISKLASEQIFKKCCFGKKINLSILRLSGIYGPGDESKSTIGKLVESAILKKEVTIFNDGLDKRDFVYVEDIPRLIKLFLNHEEFNDKLGVIMLNIATGRSYSINEIIQIILLKLNNSFKIKYLQETSDKRTEQRNKEILCDISLIKKIFPEFRFTTLEKGLSFYIKEYQNREEKNG